MLFRSDRGYRIEVAATEEQAKKAILVGGEYALAIVDLELDGRDVGWDLVRLWTEVRPDAPVLIMTGTTDANTLARLRRDGWRCLFKPVPPELLADTIAELTSSAENRGAPPA